MDLLFEIRERLNTSRMKWIDDETTAKITLPLIPLLLTESHGYFNHANEHPAVWQIIGEMLKLPPKKPIKIFWKYKIEYAFPPVEEVVRMKLDQNNSDQVLDILFRIFWKNIDDVLLLVGAFPAILRATTSDGVLPIHLIAEKCSFDTVTKCVFEGMEQGLDFGGLTMKKRNGNGESPVSILSARITSCHRRNRKTYIDSEKWLKFRILLQTVAMKHIYKDGYDAIQNELPLLNSLLMPPLLHSALIIGCPIYVINQILHDKSIFIIFSEKDALGRTAMEIAASNISIDGSVILRLLKAYPRAASEKDAHGNLLLHQILKTGKRSLPKYIGDDVYFIGSIVQEYPDALVVLDNSLKMYPFTIACMKGWSLEVIYALLRTNPFVLES